MDGITKQIDDYFESLTTLGDLAVESLKEQIDIEADAVLKSLQETAPEGDTGGLSRSLTKSSISDGGKRYGHRVEFVGTDKHGVPYEKIANILNYGTSQIKPCKFVTKAIRKLKGLDDRAAERFENKANELDK